MSTRTVGLLTVATAAIFLLPGCGGEVEASAPLEGLTAKQVLKKANAAVKSATSVHVVATVPEDEETYEIDMVLATPDAAGGAQADGTIQLDGQRLELRLVDDVFYLKADEAFWADNAGAEVAKLMVGKWFKGSADDPKTASFTKLTDLDEVMDELLEHDAEDGTLVRVKGRQVDGQDTVGLREHGGEGSGTLYVAQSEKKAYPLLVEPVAKADSAQATFSDWNAKVTVTAPPDNQVVDLDELDG